MLGELHPIHHPLLLDAAVDAELAGERPGALLPAAARGAAVLAPEHGERGEVEALHVARPPPGPGVNICKIRLVIYETLGLLHGMCHILTTVWQVFNTASYPVYSELHNGFCLHSFMSFYFVCVCQIKTYW